MTKKSEIQLKLEAKIDKLAGECAKEIMERSDKGLPLISLDKLECVKKEIKKMEEDKNGKRHS